MCRCTHPRRQHRKTTGCFAMVEDPENHDRTILCPCMMFDDTVLPEPGERLEFGTHRQAQDDAETAPAWPKLV